MPKRKTRRTKGSTLQSRLTAQMAAVKARRGIRSKVTGARVAEGGAATPTGLLARIAAAQAAKAGTKAGAKQSPWVARAGQGKLPPKALMGGAVGMGAAGGKTTKRKSGPIKKSGPRRRLNTGNIPPVQSAKRNPEGSAPSANRRALLLRRTRRNVREGASSNTSRRTVLKGGQRRVAMPKPDAKRFPSKPSLPTRPKQPVMKPKFRTRRKPAQKRR